jgi:hypothetical protein
VYLQDIACYSGRVLAQHARRGKRCLLCDAASGDLIRHRRDRRVPTLKTTDTLREYASGVESLVGAWARRQLPYLLFELKHL